MKLEVLHRHSHIRLTITEQKNSNLFNFGDGLCEILGYACDKREILLSTDRSSVLVSTQ